MRVSKIFYTPSNTIILPGTWNLTPKMHATLQNVFLGHPRFLDWPKEISTKKSKFPSHACVHMICTYIHDSIQTLLTRCCAPKPTFPHTRAQHAIHTVCCNPESEVHSRAIFSRVLRGLTAPLLQMISQTRPPRVLLLPILHC